MSFLPKDLLYNDKTYEDSSKNLLAAIDILEKAQQNKKVLDDGKKELSFWEKLFSSFKCG